MWRSSPRKSVRRTIAGDAGDDTFVQIAARCFDGAGGVEGGITATTFDHIVCT
jgi:hypothetical protein